MHTERYSWWSLFKHGLRHNRDWQPAYRRATLADSYDVIIIGGGGHGLATAYYLAKEHRPGRIAVLERGWLGGATPRATPPSSALIIFGARRPRCLNTRCGCGKS